MIFCESGSICWSIISHKSLFFFINKMKLLMVTIVASFILTTSYVSEAMEDIADLEDGDLSSDPSVQTNRLKWLKSSRRDALSISESSHSKYHRQPRCASWTKPCRSNKDCCKDLKCARCNGCQDICGAACGPCL